MSTRLQGRRAGSAFTLIELLVVVSIIGLLIPILLPGLKGARDQAKRVVCAANMKGIDTSLITYVSEFDTYPVLFKTNPVSWATWSFGGWTGSDFKTYCNSAGSGMFCFQTYQRPLSVYMLSPAYVAPDKKGGDNAFGTADDLVTRMPMFECPSDTISSQWKWVNPDNWKSLIGSGQVNGDVLNMSSYEQCGTSYQMNFYWFYQAQARACVEMAKQGKNCNFPVLEGWKKAFEIGRRIWRSADEQGGAARFVTIVEDPFDWGVAQNLDITDNVNADDNWVAPACGIQTMGFHGKWSRHMIAFLDGHVDYVLADTRYQRQTDWTVTNEKWKDTVTKDNCP